MDPFIGQIALFPYHFAPEGWLDCAGQLLTIARYPTLFDLLGTTYGGDGKMTFGLPDLRGRAAAGVGASTAGGTYKMAQMAGAENVTISRDMTAPHGHALMAYAGRGGTNEPAGALLAQAAKGTLQGLDKGKIYNPGAPDAQMSGNAIVPTGDQKPHSNMQPSLALRYCIALTGAVPNRS